MAVYSNRNLHDYMDKAANANSNNPNGDYDIFYQFALSNDDYIVMTERDGNSTISIQALNAAGNQIPGSNTITFQGGSNSAFVWDTGYRSSQNGNTNQTQELYVCDFQGAGGPIRFIEGAEGSELDFSQGNVVYRNASGNSIAPGASGFNPAIRSFEISFPAPDTFAAWDGTGAQPSFSIRYRARIAE